MEMIKYNRIREWKKMLNVAIINNISGADSGYKHSLHISSYKDIIHMPVSHSIRKVFFLLACLSVCVSVFVCRFYWQICMAMPLKLFVLKWTQFGALECCQYVLCACVCVCSSSLGSKKYWKIDTQNIIMENGGKVNNL